jgi:bla regulator protein BlaR1
LNCYRPFAGVIPSFFLYRKAIQLNHEFIADEAVLTASKNIVNYQTLLLGKAAQLQSLSITSQFNYSITKKRLIMMTKTTSATTAWLSRLAIVPVMTAAFMLFCVHTEAQQVTDSAKKNGQTKATGTGKLSRMTAYVKTGNFYYGRPYPSTKGGITDDQRKIYIGYEQKYAARRLDFSKTITRPEEDMLEKLFQQMTPEQQKKPGHQL